MKLNEKLLHSKGHNHLNKVSGHKMGKDFFLTDYTSTNIQNIQRTKKSGHQENK